MIITAIKIVIYTCTVLYYTIIFNRFVMVLLTTLAYIRIMCWVCKSWYFLHTESSWVYVDSKNR